MLNAAKYSTLAQAVIISISLILLGVFLSTYNNKVVPLNQGSLAHYNAEPHHPLNFLANWDSVHYIRISNTGYRLPTDAAFFPLYPVLIMLLRHVVGSPLTAALTISWLSLIGAAYYYMKILDVWWKTDQSSRFQGILMFLLLPTAVFMLAAYTEALFVFLSLAAIYFAITNKHFVSSVFLAGATATRVTGLFTVVLIASLMLEKRSSVSKVIRTGVVGVLGIMAYSIYLQIKYRNFLQFVSAQRYWGRFHGSYFSSIVNSLSLFNVLFVLVLVATIIFWFIKKRYSFALYTALFLVVPLGTGSFLTFNRIGLPAFPVAWMLYEITERRPALRTSLLCLTATFWTYYLLQFAGGYNGG